MGSRINFKSIVSLSPTRPKTSLSSSFSTLSSSFSSLTFNGNNSNSNGLSLDGYETSDPENEKEERKILADLVKRYDRIKKLTKEEKKMMKQWKNSELARLRIVRKQARKEKLSSVAQDEVLAKIKKEEKSLIESLQKENDKLQDKVFKMMLEKEECEMFHKRLDADAQKFAQKLETVQNEVTHQLRVSKQLKAVASEVQKLEDECCLQHKLFEKDNKIKNRYAVCIEDIISTLEQRCGEDRTLVKEIIDLTNKSKLNIQRTKPVHVKKPSRELSKKLAWEGLNAKKKSKIPSDDSSLDGYTPGNDRHGIFTSKSNSSGITRPKPKHTKKDPEKQPRRVSFTVEEPSFQRGECLSDDDSTTSELYLSGSENVDNNDYNATAVFNMGIKRFSNHSSAHSAYDLFLSDDSYTSDMESVCSLELDNSYHPSPNPIVRRVDSSVRYKLPSRSHTM